MLLHTREPSLGLWTGIETTEIARTSRLVSRLTGYQVQPNKAIVGRNAFAHEAGIHQDGVLKERTTYEIMDATTVGLNSNSLVLGKHSGRHALSKALEEMGFEIDGQALNTAFKRFKEIADRKKQVTAMDLEALVTDELRSEDIGGYTLEWFEVEASSRRPPHAKVVGRRCPTAARSTGTFTGDGPIDAVFQAINAATGDRREAQRVHDRRGHRGPGRARRGLGRARGRRRHRRRAGRVDRHHRRRRAGLRARAVGGAWRARTPTRRSGCPRSRRAETRAAHVSAGGASDSDCLSGGALAQCGRGPQGDPPQSASLSVPGRRASICACRRFTRTASRTTSMSRLVRAIRRRRLVAFSGCSSIENHGYGISARCPEAGRMSRCRSRGFDQPSSCRAIRSSAACAAAPSILMQRGARSVTDDGFDRLDFHVCARRSEGDEGSLRCFCNESDFTGDAASTFSVVPSAGELCDRAFNSGEQRRPTSLVASPLATCSEFALSAFVVSFRRASVAADRAGAFFELERRRLGGRLVISPFPARVAHLISVPVRSQAVVQLMAAKLYSPISTNSG